MRKISPSVLQEVLTGREKECALKHEKNCDGRLTIEHGLIFAGRQMDESWCLLWLCAYHHSVDKYQDNHIHSAEKSLWVVLNQASWAQLRSISKAIDYIARKEWLNNKYGNWPVK